MGDKPKTIADIFNEMYKESHQWGGIIKQPEKKFHQWEKDLEAWEKRLNKNMTSMDTFMTKQMKKMENFFE